MTGIEKVENHRNQRRSQTIVSLPPLTILLSRLNFVLREAHQITKRNPQSLPMVI